MTAVTRGSGRRFGVSFVDIRLQCSHIQSISERVLEGLPRGSLHSYLECLVKVIEQQLCSSTTSSTSFSWRLPRSLYPLKVNPSKSSYSLEEERAATGLLVLPMKILDDLSICEQRAVLRAEPHLNNQPTVMQELGKTWWRKKADKYRSAIESILREKHVVLHSSLEHNLSLYYAGVRLSFQLQGRPDLAVISSICCEAKRGDCIPIVILFEFTIYEHFEDIVPRVIAYASGLYVEYGFLTVPVIVVMRNYERDTVEKIVLLLNNDKAGFSIVVKSKVKKLEELLSGRAITRRASREVCAQCDVDIRRRCPYSH